MTSKARSMRTKLLAGAGAPEGWRCGGDVKPSSDRCRFAKVLVPMAAKNGAGETAPDLYVTIQCSGRHVDARLSPDRPVAELMPELLRLAVPPEAVQPGDQQGWAAGPPDGPPFALWSSLSESGVRDGAVIVVERYESWGAAPPSVEGVPPHQRSLMVLPEYTGVVGRVLGAVSAARRPSVPALAPADIRPIPSGPVPQSLLAVSDTGSAVRRLRRNWRESAYERRLERLIQAPQLRRCVTIAVVSPKGGVGKTTITALLGGIFALLRRDRIVAVDTNPDYGSLGRSLAPGHGVFVDDLLEVLDSPELTVTELDTHLGRGLHGLMVLPAPTDPARMAVLDQAAYTRVIRRLQEMVGMVMLDCGTGMHDPALRAALDTADQVVLVTDADPATASLVAEAAVFLESTGVPIWLVVNRVPPSGSRLRIPSLEAHLPFARGLVVVPAHDRAAGHVAGGSFDWRDAPRTWGRAIRQLAAVLAAAWGDIGAA
jgi:MinD-like ATPase involved in chromosome partitioning or flagellar assembly